MAAVPEDLPPMLDHSLVLAARDGDPLARASLVEASTPLVASVARIYRGSRAVTRHELMQEGVVGLLRALERYDPARGTPFWAYARWWVRQAMQRLVSELTRPVVLSDRALRQLARVKEVRRRLLQEKGHEPSAGELAEASGLTREQVENLVTAERAPRALEEPLGHDDGRDGVLGELLADPVAEDAYELVDRSLQVAELRAQPDELCEREHLILRARFGLDGREQTLREVAGTLHLSAERVRQIEEHALEKLRATRLPIAS
jgi:RNA polymerase sigma factor (sigma-70 family)